MAPQRRPTAVRAILAAAMLSAGLAACATGPSGSGLPAPGQPPSEIQNIMATLGPSPLFAGLDPGDRWLIVGDPLGGRARMAVDEGLPVVHMSGGPDDLVLGRRIDQHLLAAPFLTWAWKMSPHVPPYHPVRIIVGFADTSRPLDPEDVTLRRLPDGVRVLELVWNDKALRRGTMDMPQADGPARYTVRGGEEALGKRWQEGVDLISLHDTAWPGLSTSHTRIVFVAARAAATPPARPGASLPAALISDIRLLR
ncbi:MAG: hypothetical protein RIG67_30020 [Rhodospirillales bacterium]